MISRKILVCFDEVGSGEKVLAAGRRLARLLKTEMVVINVQPVSGGITGYYERLFHEEMERIDSIFGGAGKEELLFVRRFFDREKKLPNFKLVTGEPAEVIVGELAEGQYQLAVIGIKVGSAPGKIAEEVIERSTVDLFLARI